MTKTVKISPFQLVKTCRNNSTNDADEGTAAEVAKTFTPSMGNICYRTPLFLNIFSLFPPHNIMGAKVPF